MTNNSIAVDMKKVSKSYNSKLVLNDISLSIPKGQFFGLLGVNGAGKSTLINILAGLVQASSGSVSVMGHDVIKNYRQARSALGLVHQELIHDPFFSIQDLLTIQSGYFGIKKNQPWIDELLEAMGLTDKANDNISSLSGGMKRRLLICMALVHKPEIVILDEPSAGVDVNMRQSLWKFIRQLHQSGSTIILTTHYLEEAEQLCDYIAIIDNGKIIAIDEKEQLLKNNGNRRLEQIFIDLTRSAEE